MPFPGMASNSVELRESLAKRTAEITRKCARGVDRSGSAKRPHFRFVRQSVSCARRARGGNPFVFLDGCGRVKGNNAASNHSNAWPLSENLRALLSASPSNPLPLRPRPLYVPVPSSRLSPRLPPLTEGHVWLLFLWILRKRLPWVRLCLTSLWHFDQKKKGTRESEHCCFSSWLSSGWI